MSDYTLDIKELDNAIDGRISRLVFCEVAYYSPFENIIWPAQVIKCIIQQNYI